MISEVRQSSNFDESEQEEIPMVPNIQRVRRFVVESKAFTKFQENVQQFVFPPPTIRLGQTDNSRSLAAAPSHTSRSLYWIRKISQFCSLLVRKAFINTCEKASFTGSERVKWKCVGYLYFEIFLLLIGLRAAARIIIKISQRRCLRMHKRFSLYSLGQGTRPISSKISHKPRQSFNYHYLQLGQAIATAKANLFRIVQIKLRPQFQAKCSVAHQFKIPRLRQHKLMTSRICGYYFVSTIISTLGKPSMSIYKSRAVILKCFLSFDVSTTKQEDSLNGISLKKK
jgi:hypothetical protein